MPPVSQTDYNILYAPSKGVRIMKFDKKKMHIKDYAWWLVYNNLKDTLTNYSKYMLEVRGVRI